MDLIGSREVGRILGVSRTTVWAWCEQGLLTNHNGRGFRQFDRAEVEALRRVDEAKPQPPRKTQPKRRKQGKEVAEVNKIRVRRNGASGRWQVLRGRRVVKNGLDYPAALEIACRLADADRAAAKWRLLSELNEERFGAKESKS